MIASKNQKRKEKQHAKDLEPFIVTDNGALYVCHYCEKVFNKQAITRDHLHPKSEGGVNNKVNYVPACQPCNLLKADIPYEKFKTIIDEFGTDIIRIETPNGSTNHSIVENGLSYNLNGNPKLIVSQRLGFGSRILTTIIIKTKLYIFFTKRFQNQKISNTFLKNELK